MKVLTGKGFSYRANLITKYHCLDFRVIEMYEHWTEYLENFDEVYLIKFIYGQKFADIKKNAAFLNKFNLMHAVCCKSKQPVPC